MDLMKRSVVAGMMAVSSLVVVGCGGSGIRRRICWRRAILIRTKRRSILR